MADLMREKIIEVLQAGHSTDEAVADAILAAIGEGQEPVYQVRQKGSIYWHEVSDAIYESYAVAEYVRRILYATPQPAPDQKGEQQ